MEPEFNPEMDEAVPSEWWRAINVTIYWGSPYHKTYGWDCWCGECTPRSSMFESEYEALVDAKLHHQEHVNRKGNQN